ncbi:hypothetical protein [Ferrigenium kumadai]|uniref:hypothetical protein n=1 Tax=Ferrigenium kumadai TaxID=1682490 RepID=UPI001BB3E1F9|nr:hypothetical protein [Ferrigenium kumadai]
MNKSASSNPAHRLSLRVREIAQLFNSMDPTPFLNKDLDPEANTFIETWASGFPPGSRFHITIHIEQWPSDGDPSELLTEAVHNHFAYKAENTRNALKHLMRQGRMSLVIGIVFVSLCLLAADIIGNLGANVGSNIARESLTIVGWVAMWRPLQIFLYDWWPLQRQIRLYQKLSRAHIQAVQSK